MTKGNQGRRGAERQNKGQAPKGSGGKHRRALKGRGPTPKAEERTYHPAYKRKVEKQREDEGRRARAEAAQRTRVRPAEGNEIVVGRNAVVEAARAGVKVERIFLVAGPVDGRLREVTEVLAESDAPFVEVTKRDLDVASGGAAHQGIGIEVAEYEYADLDDLLVSALEKPAGNPGLLVALDHITDPHNLGAVLRSGAAFGADGIIIPNRRAAGIGVTAWKVSAGAVAKVPAARVSNLVQSLRRAKDAGFFVVGLTGEAETPLHNLTLADVPLVLVVGAEGKGLSRLVAETCDLLISIPIVGMESLNAAVASGIALYEVAEKRRIIAGE